MNIITKNRILSIIGGIIGGIFGYFYPMIVQGYLPVLGIGIGIFYFFASNSVNKNPEKERVTDFSDYTWYSILRIMMGLLVGGAITSTIVLTADLLEQQKQQAYLINFLL